jgi:uncharacterized RDD family membrane protein YckC
MDGRYCPRCGAPAAALAGAAAYVPLPLAEIPSKDRPEVLWALPDSVVLSSRWLRFGAYLLEVVLMVVTLFIGWIIWSLIVWRNGQTPAKQLLGMRVIKRDELELAGWGRMCLRELPCKFAINLVGAITTIGYVLDLWLLWDSERQQLWDKMAGTLVVNDPQKALAQQR